MKKINYQDLSLLLGDKSRYLQVIFTSNFEVLTAATIID
jgi:hypothetical protein